MQLSKYYDSIDFLPLYNWRMAHDGKLQFLRRDESVGTDEEDASVWESLQDEFISLYGISEEFEKYLELIRKKALAEIDYIETEVRFKLNKIDILEIQINELMANKDDDNEKNPYSKVLAMLGKWCNRQPFSEREMTVRAFQDMMTLYKEQNQSNG